MTVKDGPMTEAAERELDELARVIDPGAKSYVDQYWRDRAKEAAYRVSEWMKAAGYARRTEATGEARAVEDALTAARAITDKNLSRHANAGFRDRLTNDISAALVRFRTESARAAEERAIRAEKALRPFAEAADNYADVTDEGRFVDNDATITVADLREARAPSAPRAQRTGDD